MNKTILETAHYAAIKHKNQRRKNKEKDPYINHPLEVAKLIQTVGKCNDENILKAALLHDVVEDTDVSIEEIQQEFGPVVASIVKEVTNDQSLKKWDKKLKQMEKANKISQSAQIVKLADKLSNLSSLVYEQPVHWGPTMILGYFIWSYKVINKMKHANKYLATELDKLFEGTIILDNHEFEIIPKNEEEFENRWMRYKMCIMEYDITNNK